MRFPSQKRRMLAVRAVTWIRVSTLSEAQHIERLYEIAPAWTRVFERLDAERRHQLYILACAIAAIYSPHLLPGPKYVELNRWLLARSAKYYAGISGQQVYDAQMGVMHYINFGAAQTLAIGAWLQHEVRGSESLGTAYNSESVTIGSYLLDSFASWNDTIDLGFDFLMPGDFEKDPMPF